GAAQRTRARECVVHVHACRLLLLRPASLGFATNMEPCADLNIVRGLKRFHVPCGEMPAPGRSTSGRSRLPRAVHAAPGTAGHAPRSEREMRPRDRRGVAILATRG